MKRGGSAWGRGYENGCSPRAEADPGALRGCGIRRRPTGAPAPPPGAPPAPGGATAPAGGPAPAPTPLDIATGLAPTVPLDGLTPQTSPPLDGLQVVGFPTWLWLLGWTPRTATAAGVTVTATPVSSRWDLVDQAIACRGPGRSFRADRDDPASASECSVRFRHSSASQADGRFHGRVTITWRMTWAAGPVSGRFADRTSSLPVVLEVAGYHAAHD